MSNIDITISEALLYDCAQALRYKAYNEAAQSQAPDLFTAQDTLEWSQALRVEAILAQAQVEKTAQLEAPFPFSDRGQSITPQAAEAQGYTIDRTCYPWFAYKGLRFHPSVFAYCFTDLEVERYSGAFKERADVLAFQQKFSVPMAKEPSFLDKAALMFRLKFMVEELQEFSDANGLTLKLELLETGATENPDGDMHGAADALVDLAYVLHGTALMMGLPWPMLWAEVQRANMQKERAKRAADSKRGSAYDVVKPAGWKSPDHVAALGVGPWPVLKLEEKAVEDGHEGNLP